MILRSPRPKSKSAFWRPIKPIWPFWKAAGPPGCPISRLRKAARTSGCLPDSKRKRPWFKCPLPKPPNQRFGEADLAFFWMAPDLPAAQSRLETQRSLVQIPPFQNLQIGVLEAEKPDLAVLEGGQTFQQLGALGYIRVCI